MKQVTYESVLSLYRLPTIDPPEDRIIVVRSLEEWEKMLYAGLRGDPSSSGDDEDRSLWLDVKEHALGWLWTASFESLGHERARELEREGETLLCRVLESLSVRLDSSHYALFEDIASDAAGCWVAAQLPPGPHAELFELVWEAHLFGCVPGAWTDVGGRAALGAYKISSDSYLNTGKYSN